MIDVNGGTDCLLLPDVVGCDGIWISDKLGAEKRANHPSGLVGLCWTIGREIGGGNSFQSFEPTEPTQ